MYVGDLSGTYDVSLSWFCRTGTSFPAVLGRVFNGNDPFNVAVRSVRFREAVVAVDTPSERETQEFLPQRRSRLYGITTTPTQCPQGKLLSSGLFEWSGTSAAQLAS